MSARCRNGHVLAAVGYHSLNGRIVCHQCHRENSVRYRERVRLMSYDDAHYADRHAPSAEEVERKAAVVRAIIEDARRERYAHRSQAIPTHMGLRTA